MILTVAGMAQAENWSGVTNLWNETAAWTSGIVPDGTGTVANIICKPNPDLGGSTITLGRPSAGTSWSLRTFGTAGNRTFNNGGFKIERAAAAKLAPLGDIALEASNVSSFNVPIELSRTADSAKYLRIALNSGASKGAFNAPITWSNQQLDFYNTSTTGDQILLVNTTVTGSSANRDLRAIAATTNSQVIFRDVVSATVSGVDFQIGSGSGRVIFNNTEGVVVDSSLEEFRLAVATLQINYDDQVATDMGLIGAGATWNLNGHDNKNTGTLRFNNDASFDFTDAAGEALWFADSSSETWGGDDTLDLDGFVFGTDELRFGTDANGLTTTQLSRITVDGSSVSGLSLDNDGYLIPEPSTIGLLGFCAVTIVFLRRLRI